MKKLFFINAAAFLCAFALFGGSAVYAASRMDKLESVNEAAFQYDDSFQQGNEPGIAEILGAGLDSRDPASPPSSEPSPEVSEAPSAPSSMADSSEAGVPSSVPVSPEAPISSSAPPVSSKPAPNKPVSSAPPSSQPPAPPQSEVSEIFIDLDQLPETSFGEDAPLPENPDAGAADPALLDMVAGAVQREIIGVNTTPSPKYYEAYKAQAVACHSYMEYHRRLSGSYPAMSYTAPHAQTTALVAEVLNELLYYNGNVINASYHAAAGGHTQSASYVWGNDVPYLRGVESAYDDDSASLTIAAGDFAAKLAGVGISASGDPSVWVDMGTATYTDGNFVHTLQICGQAVTGRALRESVLGASNLKSPKIINVSSDGGSITFSTLGYGHGVGLSQRGALGYAANEGWSYRDILTHYYTGVTIQ